MHMKKRAHERIRMRHFRRIVLLSLTCILVLAMMPLAAQGSESVLAEESQGESVLTGKSAPPHRDAAYYAEHFPEIDRGSYLDSIPIYEKNSTGYRSGEKVPLENYVLTYNGAGYFQNELLIFIFPGFQDDVVRSIIAPVGKVQLLEIIGWDELGLIISIRLDPAVSIEDAAMTLMKDDRVRDVVRSAFFTSYSIESLKSMFGLTVAGGTGNTNTEPYPAGVQIRITAPLAPAGQVFDKWISDNGGTFANANDKITIFIMPANDVTVEATYKPVSATETLLPAPEFSGLPSNNTMYVGDTITLTPTYVTDTNTGDTGWSWDSNVLSATFNSPAAFTALKAGIGTITYTSSGGETITAAITVIERGGGISTPIPKAGDDVPTGLLIALIAAAGAAFVIRRKMMQN